MDPPSHDDSGDPPEKFWNCFMRAAALLVISSYKSDVFKRTLCTLCTLLFVISVLSD